MSKRCTHVEPNGFHRCGSYAFNLEKDGIEQGDLCDVHYWQDQALSARAKLAEQPAQSKPMTDEQRQKLRDAFPQALTSVYVCGRVWEAWKYGTMSENDFHPASECEEVLDSLVEAVHGIRTKGNT